MFQAGRFTASNGASCTFAVANDSLREQCERKRDEVEAALAAHFERHIALRLVVDEVAAPVEQTPAVPSETAPSDPTHIDVADLDGGPVGDSTTIAAARVLDAFPGATEVRT
jgi:hypothetical protein